MNSWSKVHLVARFVDDSGNEFELVMPNVHLTIEAEISRGDDWTDGIITQYAQPYVSRYKISGEAFKSGPDEDIMTMRLVRKHKK